MQRYFLNKEYQPSEQLELTGDTYHHMIRVMRMEPGDQVYIAFTDQVIVAKIITIEPERVWIKEVLKETQQKELPVQITIASGYPKGDKLEWVTQKATELGAFAIQAFPAKASVVKWDAKKRQKKQERLQKIALEAAEQSHRSYCPQVTLFDSMTHLTATFSEYTHILIAYEEAAKLGEHGVFAQTISKLEPDDRILLLFGPEGGFSPQEIALFEAQGALCCALGPRILRTETAPLYALGAISYQTELLN